MMYALSKFKAFARKVIRLSSRVSQEEIDNEARVVASIKSLGGHENIIEILDHGWLSGSFNVYYIDMELADLTLATYIDYHDAKPSTLNIDIMATVSPVFLRKDCTLSQRMGNMWAIGTHIAPGLEFMHSHGHVHRDLKPS